jgi:hypothetical protein
MHLGRHKQVWPPLRPPVDLRCTTAGTSFATYPVMIVAPPLCGGPTMSGLVGPTAITSSRSCAQTETCDPRHPWQKQTSEESSPRLIH